MAVYRCVICEREVPYEGGLPPLYPFCGARCKMVDLGKWLREDYTVDRDLTAEDVDQLPPADDLSRER